MYAQVVKIGRPRSPARTAALAAGRPTYHGSACRVCGGTERAVGNWTCIACQTTYHAEQSAARLNTYLALAYPAEFDRRGWRQAGAARGAE